MHEKQDMFEHWSFKPKTIKLVFVDSAKHTAFGSKSRLVGSESG